MYPLDVVSVSGSADTPAQYTVEEDGDNERIKIGDPDRTITGEHTYDIVYRVRGAMNAFADHDELVWNAGGGRVAGAGRQGVGGRARAGRHHAGGVHERLLRRHLSVRHRDEQRRSTAEFSKASLDPYQGMTFTVALPKGAVMPSPMPILEERFNFTSAFRVTPATGRHLRRLVACSRRS